jgi:dCMP deaminase
MRISRERMFIEIAEVVAKRGTCDRAYVGAVLTLNNRIVSIGYNGAPSGKPHCDEVGHKLQANHCTNAVHAEINCIGFFKENSLSLDKDSELVLYVTHEPCWNCLSYITQTAIRVHKIPLSKIIYKTEYGKDVMKIDFCREWGVELVRFNEN